MQFNEETMAVLKNYETINPSLVFREGNVLEVGSITKHIFSRAVLLEDVEQDFAIYNMNQFLNTINLFHEPHFEFSSNYVTMRSEFNNTSTNYYFCNIDVVDNLPSRDVLQDLFTPPNENKDFNLSETTIKEIQKAANVLTLDSILIKVEDGKLIFNVFDKKSAPDQNNFEKVFDGDDIVNVDFDSFIDSYILPMDNLKMIPGVGYQAKIGSIENGGNLLYLKATWDKKTKLEYWLTLEPNN